MLILKTALLGGLDMKLKTNNKVILIVGAIGTTLFGLGIADFISRRRICYDKDGFDSQGFNREGFNRDGFNKDGFDKNGYDCEGYNQTGFDHDGFNREGFDCQGYGRDKYNSLGIDRAGYDRQFYFNHIEEMHKRLRKANQQRKCGEYSYSLYDARIVFEEAIKLILQHTIGKSWLEEGLYSKLGKR